MRRIIETTDDRFIGQVFDETKPVKLGGVLFIIDKVQKFGNGFIQYSNSNYVVLTEKK
jgi:hypothetical protein